MSELVLSRDNDGDGAAERLRIFVKSMRLFEQAALTIAGAAFSGDNETDRLIRAARRWKEHGGLLGRR